MFVTTFYSFRGGVGRTMALVNIGAWLARHGRRVLLVDFDLESPGISHYALPNSKPEPKGVIDYLFEMSHGTAPASLEDFYFESFRFYNGGALYVMPAGRPSSHVSRFEQLNLGELYRQGDGYLILENLKSLWKTEINPDYVLIDSRTGYNEVAGICTRQLPDAVVAAFIPSPQNLTGLAEVLAQIRAQNQEDWRPSIDLHFLASSVPSMDDEDGQISDAIARSKELLAFDDLLGCVYYIPSAAHLKQIVFTLEKEHSRLAKNFAGIARALMDKNPQDPEGAKRFLDRLLDRDSTLLRSIASSRLEDELGAMKKTHFADIDVLFKLARVRLRQGMLDEALVLLDTLLESDPNASEARLLRSTLRAQREDRLGAENDLRFILTRRDLDVIQVSRAVHTLANINSDSLGQLSQFDAFTSLDVDGRASLLLELVRNSPDALGHILVEFESLLGRLVDIDPKRLLIRSNLVLSRIQQHRFADAIALLGNRPVPDSTQQDLFNYAIAEWGLTGIAPIDLFAVVLVNEARRSDVDPNYQQCLAIALSVVGNPNSARTLLQTAKQQALHHRRPLFSAWTYTHVTALEFADHIDRMLGDLDIGVLTPPAVRQPELVQSC
jgi:MinD-like ATPase involved in chromosome partitioning or flagellar assembly